MITWGHYLIWFCIQVLGTTSGIPDLPLSGQPPPEAPWTSSLLTPLSPVHALHKWPALQCTAYVLKTHTGEKSNKYKVGPVPCSVRVLTPLSPHAVHKWTAMQHHCSTLVNQHILLYFSQLPASSGLMQYQGSMLTLEVHWVLHLAFSSIPAVEWPQVFQCSIIQNSALLMHCAVHYYAHTSTRLHFAARLSVIYAFGRTALFVCCSHLVTISLFWQIAWNTFGNLDKYILKF